MDGGAGALPQHEIRHPPLSAGAHQHINRWQIRVIEVPLDAVGGDGAIGGAGCANCIHEFGPPPVVERNGEHHASVVSGVGDRAANCALHVTRRAGLGRVKGSPDPADTNIVLVEFRNTAEQLLVQPKDVANLRAWTDPVLGGETKHGEPSDIACYCGANHAGKVFFAGGVTFGAFQASAVRPPTVAVHNACDVQATVVHQPDVSDSDAPRWATTTRLGRGTIDGVSDSSGAIAAPWVHPDIRHVLVVAGTVSEWDSLDPLGWERRVEELLAVAERNGIVWLTVRPHSGATRTAERRVVGGAVSTVIVDPVSDGRRSFADAMCRLGEGPVNEASIAASLYDPADCEPDLVLILGDTNRLPPSLVWELAYSELVFRDTEWGALAAEDVDAALAEFAGRRRRFGGLDA